MSLHHREPASFGFMTTATVSGTAQVAHGRSALEGKWLNVNVEMHAEAVDRYRDEEEFIE